MRPPVYIIPATRTIIDVHELPDEPMVWRIARVSTPPQWRQRGSARRLMKRLCADADRLGIELRLEVLPSGDMGFEQLHDWYARLGFLDSPLRKYAGIELPPGGLMYRPPSSLERSI